MSISTHKRFDSDDEGKEAKETLIGPIQEETREEEEDKGRKAEKESKEDRKEKRDAKQNLDSGRGREERNEDKREERKRDEAGGSRKREKEDSRKRKGEDEEGVEKNRDGGEWKKKSRGEEWKRRDGGDEWKKRGGGEEWKKGGGGNDWRRRDGGGDWKNRDRNDRGNGGNRQWNNDRDKRSERSGGQDWKRRDGRNRRREEEDPRDNDPSRPAWATGKVLDRAEELKQRKNLWKKSEGEEETEGPSTSDEKKAGMWSAAFTAASGGDPNQSNKFLKLMGLKKVPTTEGVDESKLNEEREKQKALMAGLERQYQVSREFSHMGKGRGFGSI